MRGELPGEDPDPRFTFANERTFLAWNRTALALIAGGLAASEFLSVGPKAGRVFISIAAIVLGGVISVLSYNRWRQAELALRLSQRLPAPPLAPVLAASVAVLTIACIVMGVAELA